VLEGLFAVVLLPTAVLMWRGVSETGNTSKDNTDDLKTANLNQTHGADSIIAPLDGEYYDPALSRTVKYHVRRLGGGLGISFVAGNLSGLLGIGGGVFKVPALHLVCGMPIKAAAATSNFMIGVTATASAFLYFGRGEIRPATTASVVLGVLLGSAVGSYLNKFVKGEMLRRLFAVLLVAVALQMMIQALTGTA
jgi:hypothetical protein